MLYLNEESQYALRTAAERALEEVIRALGAAHHGKGIYLRSFHFPDLQEGYIGLVEQLACWIGGPTNNDRFPKYQIVSAEKSIRLATNTRERGHISSWESRDPPGQTFRDRFGGATLMTCTVPELAPEPTLILTSASGLSEVGDEAFTILTPMFAGWKPLAIDVTNILLKSKNTLAMQLFRKHAALAS